MTKKELYDVIEHFRQKCGISTNDYPLNTRSICQWLGVIVDEMPIKTPGLRGISHPKDSNDPCDNDLIALKSGQSSGEQNFYCAHELMHLLFHRNKSQKTYKCYDDLQEKQNSFEEWQANEGAAELLVPYQIFIPLYVKRARLHARESLFEYDINADLAAAFSVTPGVIANRANSLVYQIDYYIQHGTLEQVPIYSRNGLHRIGWAVSPKRLYCGHCLSPVKDEQQFCHMCGKKLAIDTWADLDGWNHLKLWGVGYMRYSKIELDGTGRAKICPRCRNEHTFENGEYCIICGAALKNQCLGQWTSMGINYGSERLGPCDVSQQQGLPGDARYCPYCGAETSFLEDKLLLPWEKEQSQNQKAVAMPFYPGEKVVNGEDISNIDFTIIDDDEDLPPF